MEIKKMKQSLRAATDSLREVSEYTRAILELSRLRMDEDDIHDLQEGALAVATVAETIESNLRQFGRESAKSRKFSVRK